MIAKAREFKARGAEIPNGVIDAMENAKVDMEMNPAGESPAGLNHLDSALSKAHEDVALGQPVSVAKELDGSTYVASKPEIDSRVELSTVKDGVSQDVEVAKAWDEFKKESATVDKDLKASQPIADATEVPKTFVMRELDDYMRRSQELDTIKTSDQLFNETNKELDLRIEKSQQSAMARLDNQVKKEAEGAKISGKQVDEKNKYIRVLEVEKELANKDILELTTKVDTATRAYEEANLSLTTSRAKADELNSQLASMDKLSKDYEAKYAEASGLKEDLKYEQEKAYATSKRLEELNQEKAAKEAKIAEIERVNKEVFSEEADRYLEAKGKSFDGMLQQLDEMYSDPRVARQKTISTEDLNGNEVVMPIEEFKQFQQDNINFLKQLKDCM
jgi:hypothetical protein